MWQTDKGTDKPIPMSPADTVGREQKSLVIIGSGNDLWPITSPAITEPTLIYCQMEPQGNLSQIPKIFLQVKSISKCLQN